MNVQTLTAFLMWCTIINFVLMCLAFLILAFARDWAYRMHCKWFPLPRPTFDVIAYGFLGLYKFMFFFFNVIPYVALLLAT